MISKEFEKAANIHSSLRNDAGTHMKNITSLFAVLCSSILLLSCGSDESASRISFGAGTVIFDPTDQLYQLPFSLIVTDTQGNAVSGQTVSLSVVPVEYYKGDYDVGTDSWFTDISAICNSEDSNQNGIRDAGEDFNNNGRLDPTNPATISPHPTATPTLVNSNELVTDQWGTGHFALTYPKAEANWVRVRITARTTVTGTESTEVMLFELIASQADMQSIDTTPPSGNEPSKYGIAGVCSDPN